ncbi:uncharacterized protein Z520_03850 [Fonsecaea multimorphosa CBS 102226]|uniref:Uncharacterized protein n=1 Tax=Fonsecaea multimorphosa CBS 102226 TaxID=1442371 RepID=A0A0D2KAG1_9EURO|nr:uncharacterized protein Z520_03850 [Fonsecaea multimorphosa CBS 102226]KIY00165.1 hypothetical protein Z520_03850 [Fonsecaea multimorphosa CBS 102226]OAL27359.1 hypothetical protein AYO22_03634 [Fonsecaea multimorphosa]
MSNMKLPLRPARRAFPARILPILEEDLIESTRSQSSAQGRHQQSGVTKSKVVKSATKKDIATRPGLSTSTKNIKDTKETGSPWPETLETENDEFEFLEYHLGANQEEVQRAVREQRKQSRQSIRRAPRSTTDSELSDVPMQDSTTAPTMITIAETAVPIYLHVSFKWLRTNTTVAPTVMVLLQDLPDLDALCVRVRTEHSEVVGNRLFDSEVPKKWIFESKAGEEDGEPYGWGRKFSKVCSHHRADRIYRAFFDFLAEARRAEVERLTQEAREVQEVTMLLEGHEVKRGDGDGESRLSEVSLDESAIDGFVEVYF